VLSWWISQGFPREREADPRLVQTDTQPAAPRSSPSSVQLRPPPRTGHPRDTQQPRAFGRRRGRGLGSRRPKPTGPNPPPRLRRRARTGQRGAAAPAHGGGRGGLRRPSEQRGTQTPFHSRPFTLPLGKQRPLPLSASSPTAAPRPHVPATAAAIILSVPLVSPSGPAPAPRLCVPAPKVPDGGGFQGRAGGWRGAWALRPS